MRPSIIPLIFVTTIKFPKRKVLKCLLGMKYLDIGILIPSTLSLIISEVMNIGFLISATLLLVIIEDITVVMLVEVDIGIVPGSR